MAVAFLGFVFTPKILAVLFALLRLQTPDPRMRYMTTNRKWVTYEMGCTLVFFLTIP